MADTAGIAVSVSPAQSAFFAGEEFSVTITFTNLNEPSTSYAHHFHRPPHTSTPPTTSFAPSHRRSAHSVAYSTGTPRTPRTAVSALNNAAALPVDGPLALSHNIHTNPAPRRRGLIGKGKQRQEEEEDTSDRPESPHSPVVTHQISQFKKKHISRSLSVATYPVNNDLISPLTRLPKLDTGQPDSPLTDCEYLSS